jgi:hypothetical protein
LIFFFELPITPLLQLSAFITIDSHFHLTADTISSPMPLPPLLFAAAATKKAMMFFAAIL